MVVVKKVDDGRYCAACGETDDIYEIATLYKFGEVVSVEKSVPLCKNCLHVVVNQINNLKNTEVR